MNGILMALFGTLGTFLITALGAAGIFFVRREVSGNLQCGFLGFAGGVMIAASVWSLLLPGIDFCRGKRAGWMACHDRWFFVGSHHIACGRRADESMV